MYSKAASVLFNKPIEECGDGSPERKAMKFGILSVMYKTGPATLAMQLGISEKEAKEFIDNFYKTYPKVKKWIESNEKFAEENGYVYMIGNSRKRRLPDAKLKGYTNYSRRARAMRQSTNAIIQGSSAIQTKITMLKLDEAAKERGWMLSLTVHDEVGVYMPITATMEDIKLFEKIMLEAFQISVPNKTDIEIQTTWGKGYKPEQWFAMSTEERRTA